MNTFPCSSCKKPIHAADDLVGRSILCPHCGLATTVANAAITTTSLAFRKFVRLCRQGLSGIGPSIGMGQTFIVIDNVVDDPPCQVRLRTEIAATDYPAL